MADIHIRDVDDAVLARWSGLARTVDRNVEDVLRELLTRTAPGTYEENLAEVQELQGKLQRRPAEDSADIIRQARDGR